MFHSTPHCGKNGKKEAEENLDAKIEWESEANSYLGLKLRVCYVAINGPKNERERDENQASVTIYPLLSGMRWYSDSQTNWLWLVESDSFHNFVCL